MASCVLSLQTLAFRRFLQSETRTTTSIANYGSSFSLVLLTVHRFLASGQNTTLACQIADAQRAADERRGRREQDLQAGARVFVVFRLNANATRRGLPGVAAHCTPSREHCFTAACHVYHLNNPSMCIVFCSLDPQAVGFSRVNIWLGILGNHPIDVHQKDPQMMSKRSPVKRSNLSEFGLLAPLLLPWNQRARGAGGTSRGPRLAALPAQMGRFFWGEPRHPNSCFGVLPRIMSQFRVTSSEMLGRNLNI